MPHLEKLASGFSTSTLGAGMIVGARIAFPAIVVGIIGELMIPTLLESGWLSDGEPFRKIGFVIALGTILGAAIVDITLVGRDFFKQLQGEGAGTPPRPAEDWKRTNMRRLDAWIVFWAAAIFVVGWQALRPGPAASCSSPSRWCSCS